MQTWELVAAELGVDPEVRLEPRLRDHDMGRWSGMNLIALRERFPGQEENLTARLYAGFRPPGGESYPDVADRVREVVEELRAGHAGRRVLIVAHDSVVLMFKHVIEDVPIGSVEAFGPVGNASVSVWRGSRPEIFNEVGHLRGQSRRRGRRDSGFAPRTSGAEHRHWTLTGGDWTMESSHGGVAVSSRAER